MDNILNKEFHTFIKEFQPVKFKNDTLFKRLTTALESDLQDGIDTLHQNIVRTIPNALPYSEQNPDLLSKGIVTLKKNKHFVVGTIRLVDDEPIVYNTKSKKSSKSLRSRQSSRILVKSQSALTLYRGSSPRFSTNKGSGRNNNYKTFLQRFGPAGVVTALLAYGVASAHISSNGQRSTYNTVVAGPSRQIFNVNHTSSSSKQVAASLVPYAGAGLVYSGAFSPLYPLVAERSTSPRWTTAKFGLQVYYVTGAVVGTKHITTRAYKMAMKTGDKFGKALFDEFNKAMPNVVGEFLGSFRNTAMQPVYNKLNAIAKEVTKALRNFFSKIATVMSQVLKIFTEKLPRMIEHIFKKPFKDFKRIVCAATKDIGWMSNSRFNIKLREKLGCENYNALNCGDGCFVENERISGDDMVKLQQLLEFQLENAKSVVWGNVAQSSFRFRNLSVQKNLQNPSLTQQNKERLQRKKKRVEEKRRRVNQKIHIRQQRKLARRAEGRKFVKR